MTRGSIAFVSILLGFIAGLGPLAVRAEDLTKEQMIQSLQGKTRGIEIQESAPKAVGSPPASPARNDLTDQLNSLTNNTRQITVEERNSIADQVKKEALPSIDVEVFFAYDSAAILPEALPKLITLGQALSDPQLKGSVFLIGGHTDAKGGDRYNLDLSSRRAESVKQFLVQNFHLYAGALYAIGFGKVQLKNPGDSFAGENRRVQIVNIQAAGVAQQ